MEVEQYNPKNPDKLKQVEIEPLPPPPLNITPINPSLSVLGRGDFQSKNFRPNRSGYRLREDGTLEARQGIFSGTFNIGGTQITINSSDDIQEYIDMVYDEGGGTVFLQNGTYLLTADIYVWDGVVLEGVSRDGVIIDCNLSYSVRIMGENAYSTGTVTINNGDTTVVGDNTIWTDAMVGRYILLDGLWYGITGRTDNTHITITEYLGVDLASSTYVLASTNFTATIRKITLTNATNSGLIVRYAMEPKLNDLFIYGCGTGIEMDYVVYPEIRLTSNENGINLNMNYVEGFFLDFCDLSYSTTTNVIMTNTRNSTFFNSSVNDSDGDGIKMTDCSKIAFISFDISGNNGKGIEFVSGCNDNQIAEGVLDGNTSDGIKLTASSDRNTFVAVSIKNSGGYGINIAASTCDNNQIIAPAFDNNTSGDVSDSGVGTIILPENSKKFTAGQNITKGNALYISNGTTGEKSIASNTNNAGSINIGRATAAQGVKIAQSVTLPSTMYIKSIKILMSKVNSPTDNVVVALQGDSSNKPNDIDIAVTAEVDVQASGTYTFTFSTPQKLSSGVKYWFVIRRTGATNDTNYYLVNIGSGAGSTYPDGSFSLLTTSWSTGASEDIVFEVFELLPNGYIGKAEADVTGRYENFFGFAAESGNTDSKILVLTTGIFSQLTGLSVGIYYVSNTAGEISSSPGSNSKKIGIALSSTELLILNMI